MGLAFKTQKARIILSNAKQTSASPPHPAPRFTYYYGGAAAAKLAWLDWVHPEHLLPTVARLAPEQDEDCVSEQQTGAANKGENGNLTRFSDLEDELGRTRIETPRPQH